MSAIPVTFAIIDRSREDFPMYVKEIPCDSVMMWEYYHNDDPTIINNVKRILGIESDAPCFYGVWCDYLIDPATGEICRDDSGDSIADFLQYVLNKRQKYISG